MCDVTYAAVVCLYHPRNEDLYNILTYEAFFQCIYLIDNSSTDNESVIHTLLHECVNKIIYIPQMENKGIAYSLNCGIKAAIENGYHWIMTLDQDSSFLNDTLTVFDSFLRSHDLKNVAALSPQYICSRKPVKHKKMVESVRWTIQSGMLINSAIYEKIGGLNEKLFLDGADRDYCLKAIKMKYKIFRLNEALIRHEPGKERTKKLLLKTINYGWHPPKRYYYQIYAYWIMLLLYHDMESFFWIIYKLLKATLLFENKTEYLRNGFRGLCDAQKDFHKWKDKNEASDINSNGIP